MSFYIFNQHWFRAGRTKMPPHRQYFPVVCHAKQHHLSNYQVIITKILTTFFLSLALVSCGQNKQSTDKDKERIDKVCDKFMQAFADGKIQQALQLLKQNTVMSPATIDTLQVTIVDQAEKAFASYGKTLSYELVTERKIKDFIAKRLYILKFDKYYLKFDFTLYNNGKGWTITNFNYNEDLIEVLY